MDMIFTDIENILGISKSDLSLVINRGKYYMYSTLDPHPCMIRIYQDQPAEQIRQKFLSESHMLEVLSNYRNIPSPDLIATHLTETHLILVMQKIEGISLHEGWSYFSNKQKYQLAYEFGDLLRQLHDISQEGYGFPDSPKDRWMDYINDRIFNGLAFLSGHISKSLEEKIRHNVNKWLPALRSTSPVIVHGDLNSHNILISPNRDHPVIEGIIDWEWSIAADYKYDIAQIASLFYNSSPVLNKFYQGYGKLPQRDTWQKERRIYLLDRFVQNGCYYLNLGRFTRQRKHLTEFMLSTILK